VKLLARIAIPLLLGAAAAAGAAEPPRLSPPADLFKAGVLSPALPAPEIKLQGSDGKPLSLERFRGKVVMLAFGFSSCGEVCPITLATLAGARKKLGGDAADVQVVYVTVDPERDDAARMKKFLGSFDATFVGGVGSRAEIDVAQQSYGISSSKKVYPDGGYTIGHSSSIYLIDRAGRLRAVMPYGHSSDDFVHDLRILLRS
jgi:protein SCO1/2